MRVTLVTSVAIAIVGCSGPAPTPPTVTGTLLCQPAVQVLGANPDLPADDAATAALQREVIVQVTGESFVHRVAVAGRFDEPALARAVSARPVRGSRLVEVGVALPDRGLATRVCDAILDHYVTERGGDRDLLGTHHDDVTILDHCGPPRR